MQKPFAHAILGGLLLGAAGAAQAHLHGEVVIDFQGGPNGALPSAVYGHANLALGAGDVCASPNNTDCYHEDDFVIGVVNDPNDDGAHVHRAGSAANRKLSYHSDSTGIYVRALDGHEFALISLDFGAPINEASNPGDGPDDLWEILGFNTAINPDLAAGDGTNYATRVAYQTVANGFDGLLTLDASFHNINAFWIHYKGYPAVPNPAPDFELVVDNIRLGPAVEPVPVPAAVWTLGSGVAALGALRRRRSVQA